MTKKRKEPKLIEHKWTVEFWNIERDEKITIEGIDAINYIDAVFEAHNATKWACQGEYWVVLGVTGILTSVTYDK